MTNEPTRSRVIDDPSVLWSPQQRRELLGSVDRDIRRELELNHLTPPRRASLDDRSPT